MASQPGKQTIVIHILHSNSRSKSNQTMASQPGQQTIVMHILHRNSRSKSNQTMKFGQLITSSGANKGQSTVNYRHSLTFDRPYL